MPATKIGNLLAEGASPGLAGIVRRAREMGDLTVRLRAALPDPLGAELLAASLHEDGSLVLICSGSSWAARLRFESERLLAAAVESGARAERVRVRVASGR